MEAHGLGFLLGTLLAVSGGVLLLAGYLSFNAVAMLKSKRDGRVLAEKVASNSRDDYRDARREMRSRLGEQWRNAPTTRVLVYTGGGLAIGALVCFSFAG